MDKIVVVYKPDKSVVVIYPVIRIKKLDETEEQFLMRIYLKTIKGTDLEGLPYEIMDKTLLPSREYRNAWRGEKGKGFFIDNTKRKNIIKTTLIRNKEIEKVEKIAIEELKAEGKLDQNGNLIET